MRTMRELPSEITVPIRPGRTAVEIEHFRRYSQIGTVQRLYQLSHPILLGNESTRSVIAVPGERGVYLYPGDAAGEIADFGASTAVRGTTDPVAALARIGFALIDADA